MYMHKSRINGKYFEGLDAFFGENDLFDPNDPILTSDPIIVCG